MNSKRVLVWEPREQNWTKQKSKGSLLALGKKGHRGSCILNARMFINNNYDSLITGSNFQVHPVRWTCHRGNVET